MTSISQRKRILTVVSFVIGHQPVLRLINNGREPRALLAQPACRLVERKVLHEPPAVELRQIVPVAFMNTENEIARVKGLARRDERITDMGENQSDRLSASLQIRR